MDGHKLALGPKLKLPLDAVTRTIALYGQKRQGKTSTAIVLIEEATKAGACFAWIDPTGAAWGMRSSADGEGPGLDCVIMGGLHGDVPLDPSAGEVVARLVVVDGYNIVCDLKRMTLDEQVRFVGDFSDAAYHLCQRAVTVVYDEMRRFAPQKGGGGSDEAKKCLRAVTDVVMLGGHVGLGSIAIAQRMASLHKDVGEQADVVISHRLLGVNDRKAFGGWLEDASENPAAAEQVLSRLPRLKRGEAIVLAPEYEMLGAYTIRPKATFDSSGTPEVGAVMLDAPSTRASIDLTALEAKMGQALEAAQENDPDTLRRRIKKLEQQLADGGGNPKAESELAAIAQLVSQHVSAATSKPLDLVETLLAAWEEMHREAVATREFLESAAQRLLDFAPAKAVATGQPSAQSAAISAPSPESSSPLPDDPGIHPVSAGSGSEPGPAVQTNGDGPSIKAGARRMLDVLCRYGPLPRKHLAVLSKVSPVSGTVSDYLSALRQHALVSESDSLVNVTTTGRMLVHPENELPGPFTPEQVYNLWAGDLKAGARRMVEHLMRAHPEGYTRRELAGLAGISPQSGTVSDYMSTLRRRGMVEERNRRVYAGEVLYLGTGR